MILILQTWSAVLEVSDFIYLFLLIYGALQLQNIQIIFIVYLLKSIEYCVK